MTAPRERRDSSVPVRIAHDLFWRVQKAGARQGFDDGQAFIHIILEEFLDAKPFVSSQAG